MLVLFEEVEDFLGGAGFRSVREGGEDGLEGGFRGGDISGAALDICDVELGADLVGHRCVGGEGVLEEFDGFGVERRGGGKESCGFEEETALSIRCGIDRGAFAGGFGISVAAEGKPLEEGEVGFGSGYFADGRADEMGFERAVERISDGDVHPGEGGGGHRGGLGEGVAFEEAVGEDVEMDGEGEVGFPDISERGGGAAAEEGAAEWRCRLAQLFGAERVQVAGDGTGDEFEFRMEEGAIDVGGVPAEVEGGVTHRVVTGKAVWSEIDDGGKPAGAEELFAFANPKISRLIAGTFLGEIQIGKAKEAGLFGGNGVSDHPLDDFGGTGRPAGRQGYTGGEPSDGNGMSCWK